MNVRRSGRKDVNMDLEKMRRTEYNQQYISAMRPVFDRRALYSDTTKEYVIPQEPAPYDVVTIRFRAAKNNVDCIFFVHKGQKHLMHKVETDELFDYYAFELQLENERFLTILKYGSAGLRAILM